MTEAASLPQGIVCFPEGLPGFENLTQFVLLRDEELLPIIFLTSLGEPKICLPVMPVDHIQEDYRVTLAEEDRRLLRFRDEPRVGSNALCLAVLNLGDGLQPATANLLAPIVVNVETWIAKQIIQPDSPYSTAAEVY
jgi:flagellar assembly factor FliW